MQHLKGIEIQLDCNKVSGYHHVGNVETFRIMTSGWTLVKVEYDGVIRRDLLISHIESYLMCGKCIDTVNSYMDDDELCVCLDKALIDRFGIVVCNEYEVKYVKK